MRTIGDLITITANGAMGGDGHSITTYEWKIDGIIQAGSGVSLIHTIEAETTNVECRVQNDCGNWSTPQTLVVYAEAFCPIPTIIGISVS